LPDALHELTNQAAADHEGHDLAQEDAEGGVCLHGAIIGNDAQGSQIRTTRLTAPLPAGSPAPSFGPDTDQTYELGLKSEWLDRHLIVNAATFFSKYDGIQLTYQVVTSPVTQNAGNAQIKGLELETQAVAGNHFSLLLSRPNVSMIDASASYVSPCGKATLTVGGTNITDKRYITTGQPQFAGGVVFGTYNAPREWYATLAVKL
jgi:outer membrane receptor protein involved in Fe transport